MVPATEFMRLRWSSKYLAPRAAVPRLHSAGADTIRTHKPEFERTRPTQAISLKGEIAGNLCYT
jgi:hypothetical protein